MDLHCNLLVLLDIVSADVFPELFDAVADELNFSAGFLILFEDNRKRFMLAGMLPPILGSSSFVFFLHEVLD